MRKIFFLLSMLGCCGFALANQPTQDALFKQLLAELGSLRANFQQTVFDASGQVLQRTAGTMMLKRPGQFRWHTLKPNRQLVIANGKSLWIYDVDLAQATVRPQQEGIGQSPALLLSGRSSELSQQFTIHKLRSSNAMQQRYKLIPKNQQASFNMVMMSFDQHRLKSMDLYDKLQQHIKVVFDHISTRAISPKRFEFKPPKGVDVIGQSKHHN